MYLFWTKPPKYPGAANRLHQNRFHKKKKNIAEWVTANRYLQKLFFPLSFPLRLWLVNGSFVANKGAVLETFDLRRVEWQARKPQVFCGPNLRFQIWRSSTVIASNCSSIVLVPTRWSNSEETTMNNSHICNSSA